MASGAFDNFYLIVCGRVRTWWDVLTSQTSTIFFVFHLPSPFDIFFCDIGSLLSRPSGLLDRKSLSMDKNLVCHLPLILWYTLDDSNKVIQVDLHMR